MTSDELRSAVLRLAEDSVVDGFGIYTGVI